jgi:hypothetical protein
MDFRTDDEKRMDYLEGEIGVLREALELLITNCPCTAADRFSGHTTDCPVPQVREILNPTDPAE